MATETANFNVKSNIGEVSKDAAGLAGEFKVMGVSLNSVKAGFIAAGRTAKASFATMKAGLISTGIGAFVILIGSLVTYFKNTKRGADTLAQGFAAIGAVVSVLTDRISKVGEAISFVFSGKWKEAGEALKGTFSGLADEVAREAKAMADLKRRTQELRDADNEFMVQKAKTRQEIERARLIAEDETKSAEERLDNLKKALELEKQTTEQEVALAKERVEIQEQEMALSENMAEDEEKLAQLKARLIETETASIKMRRRVIMEVNALEREIHSAEMTRKKEIQKAIDDEIKAREKLAKEKLDAVIKFREKQFTVQQQIDLMEEENQFEKNRKMLMQQKVAENRSLNSMKLDEAEKLALLETINKKYEILFRQNVENEKAAREENKLNTLSAVTSLAGALQGLAGENKTLSAATAIIDTYVGANKALAQGGILGALAAAGVIATGLANVRAIYQTDVGTGAGGTVTATPSATPQTPSPEMVSGAFTLGGGQAPEPARAYVVSDDITNNQNKLAIIRRRATI
jgi:hypothetical protein